MHTDLYNEAFKILKKEGIERYNTQLLRSIVSQIKKERDH